MSTLYPAARAILHQQSDHNCGDAWKKAVLRERRLCGSHAVKNASGIVCRHLAFNYSTSNVERLLLWCSSVLRKFQYIFLGGWMVKGHLECISNIKNEWWFKSISAKITLSNWCNLDFPVIVIGVLPAPAWWLFSSLAIPCFWKSKVLKKQLDVWKQSGWSGSTPLNQWASCGLFGEARFGESCGHCPNWMGFLSYY